MSPEKRDDQVLREDVFQLLLEYLGTRLLMEMIYLAPFAVTCGVLWILSMAQPIVGTV